MRPAELHELTLPSPTALWFKHVYNTPLASFLSQDKMIELLVINGSIELLSTNLGVICKTLNEELIESSLLLLQPWQLYNSLPAKLWKTLTWRFKGATGTDR